MRFLADENVSRHVVERLRAAGFDVAAIGPMNPGALDSDVLATARRDGRVLITEDRDFGELVVRQRLEVQGVVLLELDRLSTVAEAAGWPQSSPRTWTSYRGICWLSNLEELVSAPCGGEPDAQGANRTPCRALARSGWR